MTRTEFLNKYTNPTTGRFRDNDQFEIDEADMRDFTSDVKALLDVVGNAAQFPIKAVRSIVPPPKSPIAWNEWATRSRLLPDSLCVGTICFSESAPTDADKETILVVDAASTLLVWRDGSYSGAKVGAKWVPRTSQEAAVAGIEVFNPRSPTGYRKITVDAPASLVSHILATGPETRFFTASKDHNYVNGVPIPAPTGLLTDLNWREASPPSTSYEPQQQISYTALYNLWLDGQMVPRRTYAVYDRPKGIAGLLTFMEFDEADSAFAFGARQQNSGDLHTYNIFTDTLTPLREGTIGFALDESGANGTNFRILEPRYVGRWSFLQSSNVTMLNMKKNDVAVDITTFQTAYNDVLTFSGTAGAGGGAVTYTIQN